MQYSAFSLQTQSMDYQQMQEPKESFYRFAERMTLFAIDVNEHLARRKRPFEYTPDETGVD